MKRSSSTVNVGSSLTGPGGGFASYEIKVVNKKANSYKNKFLLLEELNYKTTKNNIIER